MGLRFRGRAPGRALPHRRPVEPILQRGKAHPERRPDADADEREPADAGRPVALLLEHDRVRREERIQDGVRDRDVDREEEHDGLRCEEHCGGRVSFGGYGEMSGETYGRAVRGWRASMRRDRAGG